MPCQIEIAELRASVLLAEEVSRVLGTEEDIALTWDFTKRRINQLSSEYEQNQVALFSYYHIDW